MIVNISYKLTARDVMSYLVGSKQKEAKAENYIFRLLPLAVALFIQSLEGFAFTVGRVVFIIVGLLWAIFYKQMSEAMKYIVVALIFKNEISQMVGKANEISIDKEKIVFNGSTFTKKDLTKYSVAFGYISIYFNDETKILLPEKYFKSQNDATSAKSLLGQILQ